jgi:hypothetical protein
VKKEKSKKNYCLKGQTFINILPAPRKLRKERRSIGKN